MDVSVELVVEIVDVEELEDEIEVVDETWESNA